MRTGIADLPLHPGRCPAWLFERMKVLSGQISRVIIENYGTEEYLRRLSDPMFFHSLSCVIGFDWNSSGTTTTTCGALKEALLADSGIAVCGGKGRISRNTLDEIEKNSGYFSFSGSRTSELQKASRLAAKVDQSCIQDSYFLYHHVFLFDEKGNWAVVQQGMNGANGYARRYHWFSTENFVDGPPENIAGQRREEKVLNLVSAKSIDVRKSSLDIVKDNPSRLRKYFDGQTTLFDEHYVLPRRHEILECDLTKNDWEMLHQAYEFQPQDYEELICMKGMGGRKLRALALISKLVYGSEADWKDPVKFSFAHGGKDGIPFPVDRDAYENSISFLRDALAEAKIGGMEKSRALTRLPQFFH